MVSFPSRIFRRQVFQERKRNTSVLGLPLKHTKNNLKQLKKSDYSSFSPKHVENCDFIVNILFIFVVPSNDNATFQNNMRPHSMPNMSYPS